MARLLREAATLIIASKTPNVATEAKNLGNVIRLSAMSSRDDQNYKILMLKRSKSMGAWPNAYVFPGGMVDKADFSSKWWEVFQRRGPTTLAEVNLLVNRIPEPLPRILQTATYDWTLEPPQTRLPPELALRLTAIRETFEECGILFARSNMASLDEPVKIHDLSDMKVWQDRVQKDAGEFMNLCLELDCCPDIWALHEWSNWLTPAYLKPRFESIFFMCTVNERPTVSYSPSEVSNHLWCSPMQFLAMAKQKEIFFPPPQMYETSRLLNFSELNLLEDFSKKRCSRNLTTMFPIQIVARDGFLNLFPGDDLYPENPDIGSKGHGPPVEESLQELENRSHYVNRSYFDLQMNWKLICNVDLRDGHKRPVPVEGEFPHSNL